MDEEEVLRRAAAASAGVAVDCVGGSAADADAGGVGDRGAGMAANVVLQRSGLRDKHHTLSSGVCEDGSKKNKSGTS